VSESDHRPQTLFLVHLVSLFTLFPPRYPEFSFYYPAEDLLFSPFSGKMKTVKSFINVAHKLSRFQWLPWIVVGVAIITVALHEAYFPPWLENLPRLTQAAFWGSVLVILALTYLAVAYLWRFVDQRQSLLQRIQAVERQAATANQRLEAVFRLSRKFVEANDEKEVVELLLHLSVDLVGALGASLVPLDERGQPMTAVNYGDLPAPVFGAWVEYLASPAVRQRCENCQNHETLTQACPLLTGPFPEALGLYCLPLRRGDREFGILNLYLPRGHQLTPETQEFLRAIVDETALALESMRMQKRELAALSQLQIVRRRRDSKGLLLNFLEDVQETLKADFALLQVKQLDMDQRPVSLVVGDFPDQARPFTDGILQGALISGEAVLLGDVTGDLDSPQSLGSLIVVPLLVREGAVLGAILVGNLRPKSFTRRHLALLRTLAGQVALFMQNVQWMTDLEYQAVMAERNRLAREIHDGLAQTLGFLKLQAAQMKNFIAQEDRERLQQILDVSYETLADAYLDVRQAIDNLRIDPSGDGVTGWLEQTVIEFQENSGFAVELVAADHARDLPPEVQAQLIRVVQEALNNVRKHAHATQTWVSCIANGGDLILEVRDDGVGFTPEEVHTTSRYGLRGMRERAELIGAEFQVISCPEEGTTVRVRLPMMIEDQTG
jgi:two-component system nitrate/nitrite sensor histidine kinase NarX